MTTKKPAKRLPIQSTRYLTDAQRALIEDMRLNTVKLCYEVRRGSPHYYRSDTMTKVHPITVQGLKDADMLAEAPSELSWIGHFLVATPAQDPRTRYLTHPWCVEVYQFMRKGPSDPKWWMVGRALFIYEDHAIAYKTVSEEEDLGSGEDQTYKYTLRPSILFDVEFPL